MNIVPIRTLLHDLSNALNAAKINAYLLRMMHGDNLDHETIAGLDSSLSAIEQLICEARQRLQDDMTATKVNQREITADSTSK